MTFQPIVLIAAIDRMRPCTTSQGSIRLGLFAKYA